VCVVLFLYISNPRLTFLLFHSIALPAPFFNVKRGVSLWLMLSGAASFTRVITEHPALRHRAVSTVLRTLLVFTSLKQVEGTFIYFWLGSRF
jgi:hypothetical protein